MTVELEVCSTCGEGTVQSTFGPGRSVPDASGIAFEVPSSFDLPTCDHCGAIWLDVQQSRSVARLKGVAAESRVAIDRHSLRPLPVSSERAVRWTVNAGLSSTRAATMMFVGMAAYASAGQSGSGSANVHEALRLVAGGEIIASVTGEAVDG